MIEQGDFRQQFRKVSDLLIVTVGFGDASHPGVRRAVRGDVKVKGLEERRGYKEDAEHAVDKS